MRRQLPGFAWMLFGLMLYIVMKDVWLSAVGDYIWPVLFMVCGVAGLVMVVLRGGSGD